MEGASSSFCSSSSSNSARNSDVRLSYSPEDTGRGFTSHLKDALREQGITFSDDGSAVGDSKCSIVIFSPNYASSASRLDDLVEILRCRETGLIVIPIFHCVRPHHVRRQTGDFGDVFARHGQDPKAQQWKEALATVCEICGKDWDDRNEAEFVKNIVGEVSTKLKLVASSDGFWSRVERVDSYLSTWHPAGFHNISPPLFFFFWFGV